MLHHMLDPAGPQAARIATLWWIFLGVCGVVFAAVVVATSIAVARKGRGAGDERGERGAMRVIAVATSVTVVTLAGLLLASIGTGKAMASLGGPDALVVRVIAHQWWWELQYEHPEPSRWLTTANELHLPVGRPVKLVLESHDVIHSLWIPSLDGKRDLIPGRTNAIFLQADRAGVFRAPCAEYCGYQHANMTLIVIADAPPDFAAWYEHELAPAAEPAGREATHGREVFLASTCRSCHAIAGTDASGMRGPDLTHVAERRSLAAGAAANDPASLAHWITDPASSKPGAQMPGTPLADGDLRALVAYLETLR